MSVKLVIFALIPLILSIGITPALSFDLLQEADALQAKGTKVSRHGSDTAGIVCGDRLCDDIKYKDSEPQNPKNVSSPLGCTLCSQHNLNQ